MRFPFTVNEDSASVRIDNRPWTVPSDSENYKALVLELMRPEHDHAVIMTLVHPMKDITDFLTSEESFTEDVSDSVVDVVETDHAYETSRIRKKFELKGRNRVFYGNREIHGSLVNRLIRIIKEKQNTKPWALFLENIYKNPNFKNKPENIVDLYDFLEKNQHPITEDGCFLAFRKVNTSYRDIHSGTTDNHVGAVNEMDFDAVDSNREQTCSRGFHVCAASYLGHFGNSDSPIMIAKVNPRDVGAIPVDYNQAKMRVSRFEIVGEVIDGKLPEFKGVVSDKYSLGDADAPEDDGSKIDTSNEEITMDSVIFGVGTEDWTPNELVALVEQHGQRGLEKVSGVPRTTIQRWLAKSYKINANQKRRERGRHA